MNNSLHDKFDPKTECVSLTWHLQKTASPTLLGTPTGSDTSGLECLVTILRLIYATLLSSHSATLTSLKRLEENNPILAFAWQDFPSQHSDKEFRSRLAAAKEHIMKCMATNGYSFRELVNCDLMNETLWSRKEHRLFRGVLEEARGWDKHVWDPAVAAEASTLVYSGRETLQVFVNSHFGLRWNRQWTSRTVWNSKSPVFIRIEYVVSKLRPLSDLRAFSTTYEKISVDRDGRLSYTRQGCTLNYNLIAVVKLREDDDEPDEVHTYQSNGQVIRRTTHAADSHNEEWLLEESGQDLFFLLYARTDGFRKSEFLDSSNSEHLRSDDVITKRSEETAERHGRQAIKKAPLPAPNFPVGLPPSLRAFYEGRTARLAPRPEHNNVPMTGGKGARGFPTTSASVYNKGSGDQPKEAGKKKKCSWGQQPKPHRLRQLSGPLGASPE